MKTQKSMSKAFNRQRTFTLKYFNLVDFFFLICIGLSVNTGYTKAEKNCSKIWFYIPCFRGIHVLVLDSTPLLKMRHPLHQSHTNDDLIDVPNCLKNWKSEKKTLISLFVWCMQVVSFMHECGPRKLINKMIQPITTEGQRGRILSESNQKKLTNWESTPSSMSFHIFTEVSCKRMWDDLFGWSLNFRILCVREGN